MIDTKREVIVFYRLLLLYAVITTLIPTLFCNIFMGVFIFIYATVHGFYDNLLNVKLLLITFLTSLFLSGSILFSIEIIKNSNEDWVEYKRNQDSVKLVNSPTYIELQELKDSVKHLKIKINSLELLRDSIGY